MDAEMVATGEGSDDVGEEAASRGLVHWHGDIPDGKELGSLTPKGRAARATPPHGGAEPLTSAAFVAAARGVLDRAAPDGDKAVILRWLVEDAAPAPHGGEAGPPEGCVVDAVPTGASGHAAPHVLHSLTRRDGGCKARSGIYRAGKFGGHVFTWSIDDSEWSTTPRDVAAYLLAYAAKHEASPLPKSEPTPRPDGLDELLDAVEAEIVAEEPAKPVDESEPVLMRWADERGGQCQSVFESSAEAEAFAKRERLTLWKVEPWKGGPAEPVDESGVERREVVAPTNDPESPDGSAHVVGGWEALYGPDTRPPAYHEARARAERLVPEAAPVDLTQARGSASCTRRTGRRQRRGKWRSADINERTTRDEDA